MRTQSPPLQNRQLVEQGGPNGTARGRGGRGRPWYRQAWGGGGQGYNTATMAVGDTLNPPSKHGLEMGSREGPQPQNGRRDAGGFFPTGTPPPQKSAALGEAALSPLQGCVYVGGGGRHSPRSFWPPSCPAAWRCARSPPPRPSLRSP